MSQQIREGEMECVAPVVLKHTNPRKLSGKLLTLIKNFIGSQWKDFKFDSVIS